MQQSSIFDLLGDPGPQSRPADWKARALAEGTGRVYRPSGMYPHELLASIPGGAYPGPSPRTLAREAKEREAASPRPAPRRSPPRKSTRRGSPPAGLV